MLRFRRRLLPKKEEKKILEAIRLAEKRTSGEIRVAIEKICPVEDPVERAIEYFHRLGMQNTKERNGVLIYLATKSKKFAIIGDEGIDKKVPEGFWNEVKERMLLHLKKGEIGEALKEAILLTGEKLQEYFPWQEGDIDELPDEIAYIGEEEEKGKMREKERAEEERKEKKKEEEKEET